MVLTVGWNSDEITHQTILIAKNLYIKCSTYHCLIAMDLYIYILHFLSCRFLRRHTAGKASCASPLSTSKLPYLVQASCTSALDIASTQDDSHLCCHSDYPLSTKRAQTTGRQSFKVLLKHFAIFVYWLSLLFVGNGKPTPSIPIPGPAWMDRSWALEALPDTASQAALVTSIRAWGQEPGINKKNCNQQSIQMPKQICPSLLARHLLLPLITCCSCHSVKNAETFVDLCAWHDLRPSVKLWYSLAYHIRPMYIIYRFITYLSIIDFNTIIVNIGMYIYIYHCHH